MGTLAITALTGGYAAAVQSNWKLAVGEDRSLQLTVADLPADAGMIFRLTIINPDGSDAVIRLGTLAGTVITFVLVNADTSAMVSQPLIYQIRRTDAGFQTLLAYGTVALYQPLPQ